MKKEVKEVYRNGISSQDGIKFIGEFMNFNDEYPGKETLVCLKRFCRLGMSNDTVDENMNTREDVFNKQVDDCAFPCMCAPKLKCGLALEDWCAGEAWEIEDPDYPEYAMSWVPTKDTLLELYKDNPDYCEELENLFKGGED